MKVATILGIFPLVGTAVIKTPEGVVVGFQIFAWAPMKKKKIGEFLGFFLKKTKSA